MNDKKIGKFASSFSKRRTSSEEIEFVYQSPNNSNNPNNRKNNDNFIDIADSNNSNSNNKNQMMSSHLSKKPKKIVIRNFKERPNLSESFFRDAWLILQEAIKSIFTASAIAQTKEELYKICENVCHQKMSEILYENLRNECEQRVKFLAIQLVSSSSEGNLLASVSTTWKDFCQQLIMIRCIFLYLDRSFIIKTAGTSSLWEMGLELFRDFVMKDEGIKGRTLRAILDTIEKDRNEEIVDRGTLRVITGMLSDLGIYGEFLEPSLLVETQDYYLSDGVKHIEILPIPQYLLHIEKRISEELERIQSLLNESSKKSIIEIIEKTLLVTHTISILEKGFNSLLDELQTSDLSRLYSLYGRVKEISSIRNSFFSYVKAKGAEIVMNENLDNSFVDNLLVFKGRMDKVICDSFDGNEIFRQALKDAFELFINQRANKAAELIAKYIDGLLRGGSSKTENETDLLLDKVLLLFRYIQGKDVFEAFYKNDLAKRLLFGRSASFDAEKLMLTKLKSECGSGFTGKLEGMFKDIEISRTIMGSFKETLTYLQLSQNCMIDFSVNVLTSSIWPTYKPVESKLPDFMNECLESFQNFYLSIHKGRKVIWQHDKSTCVLKVKLDKGSKELVVSLFQSIVLLLFNEGKDVISYGEISQAIGLEQVELKKVLQSLACGKVKILLKEPKGRDVDSSDNFRFNAKFTSDHYRIKINAIQVKETAKEGEITTEKVVQDRQYLVDAAIVRIMKTRKRLTHKALISELFQQLKFPITAADLKIRIESLIERDYLERMEQDSSIYQYLA